MLIHMCTATSRNCEIRQDPYLCCRLLITDSAGWRVLWQLSALQCLFYSRLWSMT